MVVRLSHRLAEYSGERLPKCKRGGMFGGRGHTLLVGSRARQRRLSRLTEVCNSHLSTSINLPSFPRRRENGSNASKLSVLDSKSIMFAHSSPTRSEATRQSTRRTIVWIAALRSQRRDSKKSSPSKLGTSINLHFVIASVAKQSRRRRKCETFWIATSPLAPRNDG